MKQIPILMNGQVVATLEQRKKKTRRVIKHPHILGLLNDGTATKEYISSLEGFCPFGKPGDVLYVRETMRVASWDCEGWFQFAYKADEGFMNHDGGLYENDDDGEKEMAWYLKAGDYLERIGAEQDEEGIYRNFTLPWTPAIHMPKAAARIWLEVVSIGVERLQDISEEDAKGEGILFYNDEGRNRYKDYSDAARGYDDLKLGYPSFGIAKTSFCTLWEKINGRESWNANPWVWVVEYKVLSTTGKPGNIE